ncbi:MAG: histidine phosphatase family protein [Lautropia sp.]|nr:histidine phosphatase family protein [Lautropia sp.]
MRPLPSSGDAGGATGIGSPAQIQALPAVLQPDEVRLTLVRHGETDWNQAGRIQGQLDLPLNAVGLAQAHAAASRFALGSVDVLLSSDLLRAVQTAEPIAQAAGVAAQLSSDWRERHFGSYQGQVYADLAREQPEVFARLKARDTAQDLDGGESLTALMARIGSGVADVLVQHRGKRVVLVAHGGVLDCIFRLATGLDLAAPRHFPIFNASLNHLRWQNGQWQVLHWADIAHLVESRDEIDPRERPALVAGKVG